MHKAYISATGTLLPGPPISNDAIDAYRGIAGEPNAVLRKSPLYDRGITYRNYGIKTKQESQVSLAGSLPRPYGML
ncbi:hypothetical protein JO379_000267 [Streptomyces syringium]|uniref:Uncharacterized protein n=1 Tax=Streptomyces syringium TaxID=76729 RepID=A0ABS4XYL0_9ACTN|nr:hypothetical protein [Streptomyces syringium]